VRSRRWLVEDGAAVKGLNKVSLACVDDDAQGDAVSVIWDAELDATILADGLGERLSGTNGLPQRLRGLSADPALEHRHRRRPQPLPGAFPRGHPPGHLPAPAARKLCACPG
jgi:hypothetical protein